MEAISTQQAHERARFISHICDTPEDTLKYTRYIRSFQPLANQEAWSFRKTHCQRKRINIVLTVVAHSHLLYFHICLGMLVDNTHGQNRTVDDLDPARNENKPQKTINKRQLYVDESGGEGCIVI